VSESSTENSLGQNNKQVQGIGLGDLTLGSRSQACLVTLDFLGSNRGAADGEPDVLLGPRAHHLVYASTLPPGAPAAPAPMWTAAAAAPCGGLAPPAHCNRGAAA